MLPLTTEPLIHPNLFLNLAMLERGKKKDEEAATNLAELLFSFVKLNKRERVNLRNQVERCSENFDWQFLTDYYDKAYQKALK